MIKLIWLSDLHLVEPGRDWPQGVDPRARLRRCLEEIRELHADALRLVLTGDLIQLRNAGAYHLLREELERMPMGYRLLVGNHDDRQALLDAFPETPTVDGFIEGSEDLENARLIYLDTLAADGKHHGELCRQRLRWTADRIDAAGDGPLLVFLHHPPSDIGVPALDRLRLLEADGLEDILRRRRGPTHLFCGHVHRNASGLWAGHPFSTVKSPHVQFDLDMAGPKLVRSQDAAGYGVIQVEGDRIVVNYRDIAPA